MSRETNPPPVPEQSAKSDAAIGRAFRWMVLGVISLVVLWGGVMVLRKGDSTDSSGSPEVSATTTGNTSDVEAPVVRFTEITAAAGIDFVHNNGAHGEKLLPETMGGGVGYFDYDNDGDQDLLFVNNTYWPEEISSTKKPTISALYHNDGKGSFKDVTAGSGLDVPIYGMAPAFGDFDNDGLVDVFMTAVGRNALFKNIGGGKFEDITETAGVGGAETEWSTGAAWVDFDNDRDLDLFVGNYVQWSREIDLQVGSSFPEVGRLYGQPKDFKGTYPYLYRNDGNGKFNEVGGPAGLQVKDSKGAPLAKTLGVAPVDVDQDGWMDLVVANDTTPNFLFHNEKDGTFKEIGGRSGVGYDSFGATRGAMGIDAARFRENGTLGILIGNFANEMTALYASQPGPGILFTDDALAEGIGTLSKPLLKFGAFFFDYDLDGRQDILTVNGHLDEAIGKVQKGQQYRQPAQLFWNCGPSKSGHFLAVDAQQAGEDLFQPIPGRGSAYGDIDGDGDLDVVLTQAGGKPLLLRNDQALQQNWLRLKLTGTKSNHDAIGTWVHARVNGRDMWRQVMPTRSYLSQSELPVTIGLGKNTAVELLEVKWPNGSTQKVEPQINKVVTIIQL